MRTAMRGVEEVMEGQLLEETGKFVAPSLPVVKARVAVAVSLVFMFGMLSNFFFDMLCCATSASLSHVTNLKVEFNSLAVTIGTRPPRAAQPSPP